MSFDKKSAYTKSILYGFDDFKYDHNRKIVNKKIQFNGLRITKNNENWVLNCS